MGSSEEDMSQDSPKGASRSLHGNRKSSSLKNKKKVRKDTRQREHDDRAGASSVSQNGGERGGSSEERGRSSIETLQQEGYEAFKEEGDAHQDDTRDVIERRRLHGSARRRLMNANQATSDQDHHLMRPEGNLTNDEGNVMVAHEQLRSMSPSTAVGPVDQGVANQSAASETLRDAFATTVRDSIRTTNIVGNQDKMEGSNESSVSGKALFLDDDAQKHKFGQKMVNETMIQGDAIRVRNDSGTADTLRNVGAVGHTQRNNNASVDTRLQVGVHVNGSEWDVVRQSVQRLIRGGSNGGNVTGLHVDNKRTEAGTSKFDSHHTTSGLDANNAHATTTSVSDDRNPSTSPIEGRKSIEDPIEGRKSIQDPIEGRKSIQDPIEGRKSIQDPIEGRNNREDPIGGRKKADHVPKDSRKTGVIEAKPKIANVTWRGPIASSFLPSMVPSTNTFRSLPDAQAACVNLQGECGGITMDPAIGEWQLRQGNVAQDSPVQEVSYILQLVTDPYGQTLEFVAFKKARELLLEEKIEEAERHTSRFASLGAISTFQYLAALKTTFEAKEGTWIRNQRLVPGRYARRLDLTTAIAEARFETFTDPLEGSLPSEPNKPNGVQLNQVIHTNASADVQASDTDGKAQATDSHSRHSKGHGMKLLNSGHDLLHARTDGYEHVQFKTQHVREAFVSSVDAVMAVRYKCNGPRGCGVASFEMTRRFGVDVVEGNVHGQGTTQYATADLHPLELDKARAGTANQAPYAGVGYHVCILVRAPEGGHVRWNQKVIVDNATVIEVYAASATLYDRSNKVLRKDWDAPRHECQEALKKAVTFGYEQLKKRHVDKYSNLFYRTNLQVRAQASQNSFEECSGHLTTEERLSMYKRDCTTDEGATNTTKITRSDVGLQRLFFDYGKYLLLSSSLEGSQPANLVGIWSDGMSTPWNGDYHININMQMMYWAAETLNLPETTEPLVSFMHALAEAGKETAQCMYGARGWVAHGYTDIWMNTAPVGGTQWSLCVTCGAWMANHLWEHFRFTQDDTYLRKHVLPVLEEAVEFFIDYVVEYEPAKQEYSNSSRKTIILTGPSHSPENSYSVKPDECHHVTLSPSLDTSILHQLLTSLIDACTVSQCTSASPPPECGKSNCVALVSEARRLVALLPNGGFPVVDEEGVFSEYLREVPGMKDYEDIDVGHRHFSPLFPVHPYDIISASSTPELTVAAKKTLQRKMAHRGGHTGWSAAWAAAIYARLGDSNGVQHMFDRVLGKYTLGNLFTTHPPLDALPSAQYCSTAFQEASLPSSEVYWGQDGNSADLTMSDQSKFQMDANLGGLAALVESLVQSTDRKCTCLPLEAHEPASRSNRRTLSQESDVNSKIRIRPDEQTMAQSEVEQDIAGADTRMGAGDVDGVNVGRERGEGIQGGEEAEGAKRGQEGERGQGGELGKGGPIGEHKMHAGYTGYSLRALLSRYWSRGRALLWRHDDRSHEVRRQGDTVVAAAAAVAADDDDDWRAADLRHEHATAMMNVYARSLNQSAVGVRQTQSQHMGVRPRQEGGGIFTRAMQGLKSSRRLVEEPQGTNVLGVTAAQTDANDVRDANMKIQRAQQNVLGHQLPANLGVMNPLAALRYNRANLRADPSTMPWSDPDEMLQHRDPGEMLRIHPSEMLPRNPGEIVRHVGQFDQVHRVGLNQIDAMKYTGQMDITKNLGHNDERMDPHFAYLQQLQLNQVAHMGQSDVKGKAEELRGIAADTAANSSGPVGLLLNQLQDQCADLAFMRANLTQDEAWADGMWQGFERLTLILSQLGSSGVTTLNEQQSFLFADLAQTTFRHIVFMQSSQHSHNQRWAEHMRTILSKLFSMQGFISPTAGMPHRKYANLAVLIQQNIVGWSKAAQHASFQHPGGQSTPTHPPFVRGGNEVRSAGLMGLKEQWEAGLLGASHAAGAGRNLTKRARRFPEQQKCSCGPLGEVCEVSILPALPLDWDSGQVTGLRTRCGLEVDIEWSDSSLTRLHVRWIWPHVSPRDVRIRTRSGRLRIENLFFMGTAKASQLDSDENVTVISGLVSGESVTLVREEGISL